jgi:hypothetical protein
MTAAAGYLCLAVGVDDERRKRVVKNELAFQAYNARRGIIEAETDDPIPLVCECADRGCLKVIEVTPEEWAVAHSREDQFVVAPDHVLPDLEQVVERASRYWTIRKFDLPSETLV